MKKLMFLVLVPMMLVACGTDNEETTPEENKDYSEDIEENYVDEEIVLDEDTTNEVEEIMPSNSSYSTFVAEQNEYDKYVFDIKKRYTSDQTDENGITDIDMMTRYEVDDEKETFDYRFSLMLAENREDQQNYLLFVGDVVNNTSKRVQFNHDFDVIMRDIKLEDSTYGNMGEEVGLVDAYEPEFDGQGWYALPIDSDEIPKQLEIKFERAWDENGNGSSGSDDEYLELEFEAE